MRLPDWSRVIFFLGVPSVIALFLVYEIAVVRSAQMDRIEHNLEHHESSRIRDMQSMSAFLYAICLNTAETDTARARCAIALDGSLEAK